MCQPADPESGHPAALRRVRAHSSNEEAEQEFGSIEAQRESGLAYITSQRGMNWEPVERAYNDADVSGGVLERPGLERLVADIEAGKVNVVVVQKLDRLSRRISDFTRLMGCFDQHGVMLVSVTQHLNSHDPLGRLAINSLMSFAQFEREIISERTRDKIAATRRMGLWVGSVPSLGYVVQGQRLVMQDSEARLVREIFQRFVDLGSVTELVKEFSKRGVTTKAWLTKTGKSRGGRLIDKTYIYKLLNNRLLIGQLYYDEAWHTAAHEPIISTDLWERSQALLSGRRRPGKSLPKSGDGFLLKGLVFGEDGRAYSPWTSSRRGNRVYKYHVPQRDIALGGGTSGLPRLRTYTLVQQVINHVYQHFRDPSTVLMRLPQWMLTHPEYDEARFAAALTTTADVWHLLMPYVKNQFVLRVLDRVIAHPHDITIRLHIEGFIELIRAHFQAETSLKIPKPRKSKSPLSVLKN